MPYYHKVLGPIEIQLSNASIYLARLAQSVEHETLNLRVVGSSPTLGEQFCTFTRL